MADLKSKYSQILKSHRPDLKPYEDLYKHLHQNPELSTQEVETSQLMAKKLKELSSEFDIRTKIGGHGLVGIFDNGKSENPKCQTLLLRADMDALPVAERTGLDYASTKTQKDDSDGEVRPVMHACGHDMHMTCALAAAETLIAAKDEWSGKLIVLFQPAEETGQGSQSMVDDGLYDPDKHAVPIPDVVLGQHVVSAPVGHLRTRPGPAPLMSASDRFTVTIHGRGGHGSAPQKTIDPVVIAAYIVVRLQSIVSRETAPHELAVVGVGSIHAGNKHNIISDSAVIKIDVRSSTPENRIKILESIKRIVQLECEIAQCPKPPTIESLPSFPLTANSPDVTARISESFTAFFGEDNFEPDYQIPFASEDFSILATAVKKPYCFWHWGGIDPEKWAKAEKEGRISEDISNNHSPDFYPVLRPTLDIGVDALVVGALTFLGKKS